MQQFFATWFCHLYIQVRSATDIFFKVWQTGKQKLQKIYYHSSIKIFLMAKKHWIYYNVDSKKRVLKILYPFLYVIYNPFIKHDDYTLSRRSYMEVFFSKKNFLAQNRKRDTNLSEDCLVKVMRCLPIQIQTRFFQCNQNKLLFFVPLLHTTFFPKNVVC